MALIIAGERSGVGKTTVTLALLAYLAKYGQIQSFKVGPDYIDPMFHTAITGHPCRNLDPILTSEAYVQQCFARHSQTADYVLVEGVMGLFDGTSRELLQLKAESPESDASTAHIARLLDLPVALVIDCSRLSTSVAAIAYGYCSFKPTIKIAGLILNRVGSDRHLALLQDALEPLHLPILGVLRRQPTIAIPDRHLGLVPTDEVEGIKQLFDRLAYLAQASFAWEKLLPLLGRGQGSRGAGGRGAGGQGSRGAGEQGGREAGGQGSRGAGEQGSKGRQLSCPVKIAIARDRAFKFYYPDNLELLEKLGAELIFWSPLTETFPNEVQGLYLGGGFPEVFAAELAYNAAARQAVCSAIAAGMSAYAECGGLMYLCEQLVDLEGKSWPMAGVIPATATMSQSLTLGYRQAIALQDSSLTKVGKVVWGHEFHRSQVIPQPQHPLFKLVNHRSISVEGWRIAQLHASYLHLHFGVYQAYLERFLQNCASYGNQQAREQLKT